MLVGQDGMALASHVGLQLDGVTDPEVRMARLLGVRMDLEHAIASGALTEADEVDHANSYIEWVDQQGQQYLIAARAGDDRRAASRLRSGVTVLAVGLALSIVTYLIAEGDAAMYVLIGAGSIGLILIAMGIALRFRPPALPLPARRPLPGV